MNILFLTLAEFHSVHESGIYYDLMRKFHKEAHQLYIVSPIERKFKKKTNLRKEDGVSILQVRVLNNQKSSFLEKGLSTLIIGRQFLWAIEKHFSDVNFDLILYSTPPITFTSLVRKLKTKHKAFTYLLLKDIFPQNAVDLGLFKEGGVVHRYFRKKEIGLYQISDKIGCMSPANVEYLLRHNPFLSADQVEENPNTIEIRDFNKNTLDESHAIRKEFGLPLDKRILIYGGNLGKPQGLDFLMQTVEACQDLDGAYFVVIGTGTEFDRIKDWSEKLDLKNFKLFKGIPKEDYDRFIKSCDVGLIFLDPRFTIPNFPSRLLGYLELSMPVIAATDPHTDIGLIAEDNGFGFKVMSGDITLMRNRIVQLTQNPKEIKTMGEKGRVYLEKNYSVDLSYKKITESFKKIKND